MRLTQETALFELEEQGCFKQAFISTSQEDATTWIRYKI